MPKYKYRCQTCGNEIIIEKRMSEKQPTTCECGGILKHIIMPLGFITKGKGFEKRGRA